VDEESDLMASSAHDVDQQGSDGPEDAAPEAPKAAHPTTAGLPGPRPAGLPESSPWQQPLSRRTVLKVAGGGAFAVGAGGLLEACSGVLSGTTGAGAGPASVAATAAAAPSGSAPIAATGATGDTITIGFVSPLTGQLAGFASGDQFVVDRIKASDAYRNGFKVGGKTYAVTIVVKDSQSDPNRASQVASDLILTNKVDLIVTSSTPETTNPVAQVAEVQKVPCLSTVVPWQAWFFPRQADPANPKPFKYTTMFFFGAESFGGCFIPMWNRVAPANKVVSAMLPNDDDGNAFRTFWKDAVPAAGYKWVDGGAYTDGTSDFTSMISQFKTAKADVFINAPLPPDFNTFWKQAAQQGYKPKLATVAKVLLFPADCDALGDLVINIATDCWWGPFMPYKSSLTNETSQQLADAYTAASGKQWLQSLGSTYSLFEIAQIALTAASDPHSHDDVAAQLGKVKYTGICGPLDFTTGPSPAPGAPAIPGIGIIKPVGVQWRKGTKFPYEMVVVDNSLNPDVPIGGDLLPTNA
jgi:branched-chain amino acid transport system substrate-binding protein